MSDLIALAEKVERLTGPDRGVDREIHREVSARLISDETIIYAIGSPKNERILTYAYPYRWAIWWPPKYTESFDAAISAVPRWMHWDAGETNPDDVPWACITDMDGNDYDATGATPALALTAAALRSIASQRTQS